ncbi:hypothetical protein [Rurimicrobium arvi]|uniref:Uncharacterized protein n=1 Tax=Rurimicrobium arvi TaxID=2049916 RepID=A0ABP8MVC0_9BACT
MGNNNQASGFLSFFQSRKGLRINIIINIIGLIFFSSILAYSYSWAKSAEKIGMGFFIFLSFSNIVTNTLKLRRKSREEELPQS